MREPHVVTLNKILAEKRMSKAAFQRLMGFSTNNFWKNFNRDVYNQDMIDQIIQKLNIKGNPFADEQTTFVPTNVDLDTAHEVEKLRLENAMLKEQIILLKEMVELLKNK